MKRNLNTLMMCVVASLSLGLVGCQKDETQVVKSAAPPPAAEAVAGAKPAGGGAVFTPPSANAPSGLQTGNYAGGKKD
jgi:hypothetical protein